MKGRELDEMHRFEIHVPHPHHRLYNQSDMREKSSINLHAAMLDLSVSQEANRSLIRGVPELSLRKVEGIVEANDRVKLLSKGLEVSLRVII
mmetsp:Transcript_14465/g.29201  ORF Transcript_14465/g.29201 Transcript_14465/m.29201 type:complete len:92 (-) Transcript_14465:504-779(-)